MLKLLGIPLLTIILSFTTDNKQQEKEYLAKLTVGEWQTILSNQDDVPKNARDKVIQKIALQINQQIVSDTTKKK